MLHELELIADSLASRGYSWKLLFRRQIRQ